MRSTLALAAAAALATPASAFTVDWARALSTIPEEMRNATAAEPLAATGKVSYCTKPGAHASGFKATIVPLGPNANQNVETTFDYTLDKEITEGATATYTVTYNFIPLSPTVDNLCATQKVDLCPLKVGVHHSTSDSTWPSGLSGTIVSKIQWKDQDGQEILCLQWTVNA